MILYFAYGSNILRERLEERVGPVQFVKTVKLPFWKLQFNCGNGFADIVPSKKETDFVEGVIYEITAFQTYILDQYEGLYTREILYVGNDKVWYYKGLKRAKTKMKPFLGYINIILDGCLQNNLLDTYNKLVDYKKKTFNIKFSRHKKILK